MEPKIPENYVRMEQRICPVCGVKHNHKCGILLHKHLREIPEEKAVTGYGLCERDDKLYEDGFIALVVVSNEAGDTLKVHEAHRTGEVIYLRREVFIEIFHPSEEDANRFMVFIDVEGAEKLKSMMPPGAARSETCH